jgi:hypothetical protein
MAGGRSPARAGRRSLARAAVRRRASAVVRQRGPAADRTKRPRTMARRPPDQPNSSLAGAYGPHQRWFRPLMGPAHRQPRTRDRCGAAQGGDFGRLVRWADAVGAGGRAGRLPATPRRARQGLRLVHGSATNTHVQGSPARNPAGPCAMCKNTGRAGPDASGRGRPSTDRAWAARSPGQTRRPSARPGLRCPSVHDRLALLAHELLDVVEAAT